MKKIFGEIALSFLSLLVSAFFFALAGLNVKLRTE